MFVIGNRMDKSKMEVVWDYDYLKFKFAAMGEVRSIIARHPSGIEQEFKTRTELWGNHHKKAGGWLAEYNKDQPNPLSPSDFIIEDVQRMLSPRLCFRGLNYNIQNVLSKLGKSKYYGYIGKGESWRVQASTILRYKGDRKDLIRPLHLENVENYLIKKHGAILVRDWEADDHTVADCYANPKLILVGVDHDYCGCKVNLFNPDKMEKPSKIDSLGTLYIDAKGKVRGEGRMYLYHQVLSGDSSDHYKANAASDMKWSDKSAHDVLVVCKTDKECLQAMIESFKKLYPEPKSITGWRGDTFEIDWFYVMQECFTMAHMLRFEGDKFCLKTVLDKLKINY